MTTLANKLSTPVPPSPYGKHRLQKSPSISSIVTESTVASTVARSCHSGSCQRGDSTFSSIAGSSPYESTSSYHESQCYESTDEHEPQPQHEQPKFLDVYHLRKELNKGTFSHVWEAINRRTFERTAVKIIDRRKLNKRDDEAVFAEVKILHSLRHPGIIRLLDFYVTPKTFYVVLELTKHGDLFDQLMIKKRFGENQTRHIITGVLESLEYFHSRNIVHRDLKPENLLLMKTKGAKYATVKVADFGFAGKTSQNQPKCLTERCGTPMYVAPEILRGKEPYDESVDMWSLGVITYFLLVGYPPFLDKDKKRLFRKILSGNFGFDDDKGWSTISEEAKDFIMGCLTVDPSERMTAREALKTDWIISKPVFNVITEEKGPESIAQQKKLPSQGPMNSMKSEELLDKVASIDVSGRKNQSQHIHSQPQVIPGSPSKEIRQDKKYLRPYFQVVATTLQPSGTDKSNNRLSRKKPIALGMDACCISPVYPIPRTKVKNSQVCEKIR
mmetsp:Transcript_50240/g.60436  ORF Transcript_50240/g.60436 Transcript_50240/m.60436 type:complete len:501 (+) Transcript_50240:345-1847(+)